MSKSIFELFKFLNTSIKCNYHNFHLKTKIKQLNNHKLQIDYSNSFFLEYNINYYILSFCSSELEQNHRRYEIYFMFFFLPIFV